MTPAQVARPGGGLFFAVSGELLRNVGVVGQIATTVIGIAPRLGLFDVLVVAANVAVLVDPLVRPERDQLGLACVGVGLRWRGQAVAKSIQGDCRPERNTSGLT